MTSCLEARRRLLAAPRERPEDLRAHMSSCSSCARFADHMAALDRRLLKATRVPVPEGLNERIVLANAGSNHPRAHRAVGAAAAALIISIAAVTLLPAAEEQPALAAETVAQAQTAVSAISMVLDGEPARLRRARHVDPGLPAERLHEVGLALKKDEKEKILARYLGRCQISGRACEHLELLTYDGYVSVILMENEHPAQPVLVADRRMAALLSPAPHGAYIVIAQSPQAAKRAQKLFERS